MFTKLNDDQDVFKYTNGTSFKDSLKNVTFHKLVEVLGSPTFEEPSGDDKIQKEWVFVDQKGNGFTLYDWKTYDEDYTVNKLTEWNIGSRVNADHFLMWLEQRLK